MKSYKSSVTFPYRRLSLRVLVCLGAALLVTSGVVLAQEGTGPTCFDENNNEIDCATLMGNLGEVEGGSVECGLNPYKFNTFTGTYEREFNKFCAPYTGDANEVLFHGLSLLEAQQVSEAAGLSGNHSVTQMNDTTAGGPGRTTGNSLSYEGPPEVQQSEQYQAQQTLNEVKNNLENSQQGQSETEKDDTNNDWAGVFRFFFLGLQQAQQGRTQGTQSF